MVWYYCILSHCEHKLLVIYVQTCSYWSSTKHIATFVQYWNVRLFIKHVHYLTFCWIIACLIIRCHGYTGYSSYCCCYWIPLVYNVWIHRGTAVTNNHSDTSYNNLAWGPKNGVTWLCKSAVLKCLIGWI